MSFIHSVVDQAGNGFLTDNTSRANQLISAGATPVASLFDSLDSPKASPVHELFNTATGEVAYSISTKDIHQKISQGFKDNGRAFDASTAAEKGLKPIYRLYRASDTDYQYLYNDALIRTAIDDGYVNQGIAWYSPVNNGKIKITDNQFDPVTGKLTVDYKLDPLLLGQFRNTDNLITFRLVGIEAGDAGTIHTSDAGTADLKFDASGKSDQHLQGTVSLNAYKKLGLKNGKNLDSLSLSLNTKYGKNPQYDASLYGFARTSSLSLEGINSLAFNTSKSNRLESNDSQGTTINDSSSLSDIGYENLRSGCKYFPDDQFKPEDIKPGVGYCDHTISGKTLIGADWHNVQFKHMSIHDNNLTGANLSNTQLESDTEEFVSQSPLYSRFYRNDISGANLNGFYYSMEGANWDSGQNIMRGAVSPSNIKDMAFASSGSFTPCELVIHNESSYPLSVDLMSPQFKLGTITLPSRSSSTQEISLAGTAYGNWGNLGHDDVYARVYWDSPQAKEWMLSARNFFGNGNEVFYIYGEGQTNVGRAPNLRWDGLSEEAQKYSSNYTWLVYVTD